jgi:hypothetical protein
MHRGCKAMKIKSKYFLSFYVSQNVRAFQSKSPLPENPVVGIFIEIIRSEAFICDPGPIG